MKTRTQKKPSITCTINRHGRICIPQWVMHWKLGQRVFFSVDKEKVIITETPKGLFQGRILSSRIKSTFSRENRYQPAQIRGHSHSEKLGWEFGSPVYAGEDGLAYQERLRSEWD